METRESQKRINITIDSDPTYEAWKLDKRIIESLEEEYSDPTYEAWKHREKFLDMFRMLILRSYLRGMETDNREDKVKEKLRTPILPTRHGNTIE